MNIIYGVLAMDNIYEISKDLFPPASEINHRVTVRADTHTYTFIICYLSKRDICEFVLSVFVFISSDKVLVRCMENVSHSATIFLVYLMIHIVGGCL